MEFTTILYQTNNGVLTIALNRPEVFNACNETLTNELQSALSMAENDQGVRVIILTGSGKAFCSGQDLKDAPSGGGARNLTDSLVRRYNPIIRSLRSIPKPVICGINGVAAGAGLSLALACDVRIMSTSARLVEAFAAIALIPDSGATFFYPRMMGYSKAFEFATLNKPLDADAALQLGLVNYTSHPKAFAQTLESIAAQYAAGPTQTYGMIKKLLQTGMTATLDEMLDLEADYQQRAGNSNDYAEGVAAFAEKRKPTFSGK